MKNVSVLLVICLTISQSILIAQNAFEGIVELSTFSRESGENAKINWYIQGGNHKLEISGSVADRNYTYNILIPENDPAMKVYSEYNGETTVYNVPHEEIVKRNETQPGKLVTTKETKSIAGYKSTLVKITSDSTSTTCWVSNDINLSVEKYPSSLKSNPVYGVLAQNGVTGFPMEIKTVNHAGDLINSVKVENVTAKKLDPSIFKLPASYIDGEEAIKESFPK